MSRKLQLTTCQRRAGEAGEPVRPLQIDIFVGTGFILLRVRNDKTASVHHFNVQGKYS